MPNQTFLFIFPPPEPVGPSSAYPQHLGFCRGQLLPAATLTSLAGDGVPPEGEGAPGPHLCAVLPGCCLWSWGHVTALPLAGRRAGASPVGFSRALGQVHPLMSARRGAALPLGKVLKAAGASRARGLRPLPCSTPAALSGPRRRSAREPAGPGAESSSPWSGGPRPCGQLR